MKPLKEYKLKEVTFSADPGKILHIIMHSDFTPDGLRFFAKKSCELIDIYHLDKILNDARLISAKSVEENRGKLTQLTESYRFKKIAMLVSSGFQKVVNSFIVTAGHNSVRFFSSEEEAFAWLKEK